MGHNTVGLVMVFTGDGKGKTTAALGTALRAWGQGMRVCVLQFIKGNWTTGEEKAIKYLNKGIELRRFGAGFIDFNDEESVARHKKDANEGLAVARLVIESRQYQMVILDEINYAVSYGLVDKNELVDIVKNKPKDVHLILTGRNAPQEIIEIADLVTKMDAVKHPYKKGIAAQRGIEY
nr:cob(I)yrinic acid a,c-diamide adenosyltransferase [Desulfofalx alkaliphila]